MSERIVLGFDYGSKRIGVAIGQSLTASANPLNILDNNKQTLWDEITRLVSQWQPTDFVVGLPVHADGTDNAVTPRARKFGRQLQHRYQLPVHWIDERLTSMEAEQRLQDSGRSYSKGDIDKIAAQIIVESWLRQQS